jgi:hypothetical protein
VVDGYGKFNPANIERGRVTSSIGLDVDDLDFTWRPQFAPMGNSVSTFNKYQLAYAGFYDNKDFMLWNTLMPTPGDANTFGACEKFGGRITRVEIERNEIRFKVTSKLDVVKQVLPRNVIASAGTLAGYAGATPVVADSESTIAQFTVVSPSTGSNILANCTGPTPGKIYGTDKFAGGFIKFNKGSSLADFWSPIGTNQNFNAGGGIHRNQFKLYGSFPAPPVPGDTFYASAKPPVNLQEASTLFGFADFPYVVAPEAGTT